MANAVYTRGFTGNKVKYLAELMKVDSLKAMFWGQFAQFNTKDGESVQPGNRPAPSEAVVVIHNQLQSKGKGDILEIPRLRQLGNRPRMDREQAKDHEERFYINTARVPISLWRHGVLPEDGEMMTQTLNDIDLVQQARPSLLDHYARTNEYLGAGWAMYNGFDYKTLNGSHWSSNSLNIAKTSHPHIYVAGWGKVSYDGSAYPGTAAYEAAVAEALESVDPTDVFNCAFLRSLKGKQDVAKIMPIITKDGKKLRLMVVHPYQITSLENDPEFNANAASIWAQSAAKDNPLLFGVSYIYAGFAIFVSDTACWPVRVASSLPEWGPDADDLAASDEGFFDHFENYETCTAGQNTMFAGLILGKNALFKAHGSMITFRKRSDDYEDIQGVLWRSIEGWSRGDFYNEDDGTRGETLLQKGSAIFVTHALDPEMSQA